MASRIVACIVVASFFGSVFCQSLNLPATISATIPAHIPAPTNFGSPAPIGINGKRGFAFNDPGLSTYFSQSGQMSKISWSYNWASDPYFPTGQYPPESYNRAMFYAPMLWGNTDDMTSIWDKNVAFAIANYATDSVLAFNEPDTCCAGCGGTCMDVGTAVSGYRQWIQPYAGTVKLGSPAVTNGIDPGMGFDWLRDFMNSCTGCQVDFIAIHWYGDVNNPQSLKDHVKQAWEQFKLPIWLTEFGVNSGSEEQIVSFLKEVMPWLDRQGYVEKYAYFMARDTGAPYMLNPGRTMNSIGSTFMSA